MAGTPQAGRARSDAGGYHTGSYAGGRDWPVSRRRGRGAVDRVGGRAGQRARPWDEPHPRGVCARFEGGLIVTASAFARAHRNVIVEFAARHKLPAVYYERSFVADGGLISYGPDVLDQYRRKGAYVDRILKGEKPADLPVQTTTKYELVVNLKTAKALGLDIPATVLAGVDDVME